MQHVLSLKPIFHPIQELPNFCQEPLFLKCAFWLVLKPHTPELQRSFCYDINSNYNIGTMHSKLTVF